MIRVLKAGDPAARVLADAKKRRYLSPFLGRPRRLSEAARELGVSPSGLYYWIRRFLALGLLKREGLHYVSPAPAYFVPFSESPAEDLADWLSAELAEAHRELLAALGRRLEKEGYQGLLVFRNPEGTVTSALARGPRDPAPLAPFGVAATLHLTLEESERLKAELTALWQRYAAKQTPGPGRRPVRVYAFLAED